MKEPVYITFANKIAKMIDSGIYKPGDKLPSIRSLHKKKGLSIGTDPISSKHMIPMLQNEI